MKKNDFDAGVVRGMMSESFDRPLSSQGRKMDPQYDVYVSDDGYDEVDIDYPNYGQVDVWGQMGHNREMYDRPGSRGAAYGY